MRQLKIAKQITNRDSQAVEKYLQEIGKIEMITPEEETRLAQKIKAHKPWSKEYQKAVDSFVSANLRFVVSVAKQYQHQWMSLSDLISEWNLGCIKAVQRFDETKWFKFISYAVWRIRQSILQALAEEGRIVRLPQNKIGTANKIGKAIQAFEQEHERQPTDDELAELLDMSPTEINNVLASNIRHSSLDADLPWFEWEGMTMWDLMHAESQEVFSVFTFGNNDERTESIHAFLKAAKLSPREEEITLAYFWFGWLTSEYVEKKYDLTKERVRQIKERTIKRLQKRNGAMNFLRDDIIIESKKEEIKNNSDWINASKPLWKPLQEWDLKPIDTPIITPKKGKAVEKAENKKKWKHNKNRKVNIRSIKEIPTTPLEQQLDNAENVENNLKETHESDNLPDIWEVIREKVKDSIIKETKGTLITELQQDSHVPTTTPTVINQDVIEKLDTISLQLTSLQSSLQSYVKYWNIDNENIIIANILQQLETTQSTLDLYQKMYVDNKEITYDNIIKDKIEIAWTQLKNINYLIIKNKTPLNENNENEWEKDNVDITVSELVWVDKIAYSNEKLNKILETNFNWSKYLWEQPYDINKRQCINTFMDYYFETIKSPIGKSYSQETILREAKLRTWILIGQDMFNTYITEFLESIWDL